MAKESIRRVVNTLEGKFELTLKIEITPGRTLIMEINNERVQIVEEKSVLESNNTAWKSKPRSKRNPNK